MTINPNAVHGITIALILATGCAGSQQAVSPADPSSPSPEPAVQAAVEPAEANPVDGPVTSPPAMPVSHVVEDAAPAAGVSSKLDTFDDDVKEVKARAASLREGVGIAVRFANETTGNRLSLGYLGPGPQYSATLTPGGMYLLAARASVAGQPISSLALGLSALRPGHYLGSEIGKGCVVAHVLGSSLDVTAEQAGWSLNSGGSCDVHLHQVKGSKDLEGDFTAKLVTNKGTGFFRIESGYVYIKR